MRKLGLGALRYSPSSFYEMTIPELKDAIEGFVEVEERESRRSWTQARWIASVLLQPHSKNRIKPEELAKFPWEAAQHKSKESQDAHNRREIETLRKIFNNGSEEPNA